MGLQAAVAGVRAARGHVLRAQKLDRGRAQAVAEALAEADAAEAEAERAEAERGEAEREEALAVEAEAEAEAAVRAGGDGGGAEAGAGAQATAEAAAGTEGGGGEATPAGAGAAQAVAGRKVQEKTEQVNEARAREKETGRALRKLQGKRPLEAPARRKLEAMEKSLQRRQEALTRRLRSPRTREREFERLGQFEAAFVTFNNAESFDRCARDFAPSTTPLGRWAMPDALKVRGTRDEKVGGGPGLWGHLLAAAVLGASASVWALSGIAAALFTLAGCLGTIALVCCFALHFVLQDEDLVSPFHKDAGGPGFVSVKCLHALTVVPAPEPTDILWENLDTHSLEKLVLRTTSNAIALLLLLISFYAILTAKNTTEEFQKNVPTVKMCGSETTAGVLPATFFGGMASPPTGAGVTAGHRVLYNASQSATCNSAAGPDEGEGGDSPKYYLYYENVSYAGDYATTPWAAGGTPRTAAARFEIPNPHDAGATNLTVCNSPCAGRSSARQCASVGCVEMALFGQTGEPCFAYAEGMLRSCHCMARLNAKIEALGLVQV